MPSCSPSSPIKRTSFSRMSSLISISFALLIEGYLQFPGRARQNKKSREANTPHAKHPQKRNISTTAHHCGRVRTGGSASFAQLLYHGTRRLSSAFQKNPRFFLALFRRFSKNRRFQQKEQAPYIIFSTSRICDENFY